MMKNPEMWDAVRTLIKLRNQAPPLVPVARERMADHFPLSFSQERVWFLDQLNPGSSAYNLPVVFRLKGPLNVRALEQSLSEIQRRHAILRTSFNFKGGPVQEITPPQSFRLPVVELYEGSDSRERERQMMRLVTEATQTPFDLSQGALFRAGLIQLSEDEHVVSLIWHHIIFDFWSRGVVLRELAALYKAFASLPPPHWEGSEANDTLPSEANDTLPSQCGGLPELPIQYADFALWQRKWLEQAKFREVLLSYWNEQLQGLAELPLPTDYARPAIQSRRSQTQKLILEQSQTKALKAFTRQEGCTLFVLLLAAFKFLLHRYTEVDDIFVCSPFANRNRSQLKKLIGYLANVLVLRSDLSGDPTFGEFVARVGQTVAGAIAHQDLPTQYLKTRTPLTQVLFALQNTPANLFTLPDLTVSWIDVDSGRADFDLFFKLVEEGGTITGWLKYKAELFDERTISQLLANYQGLLERLVAHPEQALSSLPLLATRERKRPQPSRQARPDSITDQSQPTWQRLGPLAVAQAVIPPASGQGLHPKGMRSPGRPQTEVERRLAQIWQDVLGLEQIGINQNFFELGGNSLLLVQVHHQLQEYFKSDLMPVELFQYPTISTLAQYLTQKDGQQASKGSVPASPAFQEVDERTQRKKEARKQRKQRRKGRRNG